MGLGSTAVGWQEEAKLELKPKNRPCVQMMLNLQGDIFKRLGTIHLMLGEDELVW